MPHIANPLPGIIQGGEQRWETIAHTARDLFHSAVSFFEDGASIAAGDVKSIVATALDVSQTMWSTYISTLEAWTITGIDEVASTLDDARAEARTGAIELGQMIDALSGRLVDGLSNVLKVATTYTDDVVDTLARTVLGELGNVETWAIDNIASPLLNEIAVAKADVLDALERGLADVETYARDLVSSETLDRVAALAGLAAIVAALGAWIDECGVPMCETYGPGTDLTKLLKGLEALLGILAGVGLANLTERDVERIASYFLAITAGDAEGFVNAFAGAGETLGSAGGTIVSDLGHIAAETFASVSGL